MEARMHELSSVRGQKSSGRRTIARCVHVGCERHQPLKDFVDAAQADLVPAQRELRLRHLIAVQMQRDFHDIG